MTSPVTVVFASTVFWAGCIAALIHPAASFSLHRHADATTATNRPVVASPRWSSFGDDSFASVEGEGEGDSGYSLASNDHVSRRALFARSAFAAGAAAATAAVWVSPPEPAGAFSNAVPDYKKYADRAKRRGTAPRDLGVMPRSTEGIDTTVTSSRLRSCDGNPNCFSTTGDELLEDRQQYGVDFLIAPWVPPSDETAPMKVLARVVEAYEPGQGGVDGGGFALVKETDSYLYFQFEALKKGYIDDLEFAVDSNNKNRKNNAIMVRSASRVGVTDFGVNAIRLNYIAGKLRAKGWTIAEITPESHRDYWIAANEAREATFDADRRNMD